MQLLYLWGVALFSHWIKKFIKWNKMKEKCKTGLRRRMYSVWKCALNLLPRGRRGLILPYSPTCLWIYTCYFLCLFYCRNLSKLLFTSTLPRCKGIYLYLIRSTGRDPEILILCLYLTEEQGKDRGRWREEKVFSISLFPWLPRLLVHRCLSTQAHPHLLWSLIEY